MYNINMLLITLCKLKIKESKVLQVYHTVIISIIIENISKFSAQTKIFSLVSKRKQSKPAYFLLCVILL